MLPVAPDHDSSRGLPRPDWREQMPMLVLILFCAVALLVLGWVVLRELRTADRWAQLPPPSHSDSQSP
jgi:hypothetical protein